MLPKKCYPKLISDDIIVYKKNPHYEGFLVAPAPGLEPGTHGLTVHCSNQLSYAGINIIAVKTA